MSININLYKNKNAKSPLFGKVYGRAENKKPIDIDGLAAHMALHGTVYTADLLAGVLKKAASCIRELAMDGQPVKLGDLAIFKASVVSKPADDVEEFTIEKNIKSVRLVAMATGKTTSKSLSADALFDYTSLAKRIKAKEVVLSDVKGKYLETDSSDIDDVQP